MTTARQQDNASERTAAEVRALLVGTRFTSGLQHFASVGSTNALLLEAAAGGAPQGTVYVADEQTAGRGRGGHGWHSAPGEGLYVSALLRPTLRLQQALLLSLATGVAAAVAVRQVAGLAVDLRWPNDLMLSRTDGSSRKCGGILVETAIGPPSEEGGEAALRYAVVGIGINVAHKRFPEDLQGLATSLAIESGREIARTPLLVALLRALDLELNQLEDGDVAGLFERFAAHSSWVRGKRVNVPEQGGYTGVTAGLDDRGFLRVDCNDGVARTVLTGGVREAA
jgi:BirA family biotin operon repressor/biotin-[acetyl-CoA-carboxylase] ligase